MKWHDWRSRSCTSRSYPLACRSYSFVDLLPEGFDARYDARPECDGRENLGQIRKGNLTKETRGITVMMKRMYGIPVMRNLGEVSYTPLSPSAKLPPERGPGLVFRPDTTAVATFPTSPTSPAPTYMKPKLRDRCARTAIQISST